MTFWVKGDSIVGNQQGLIFRLVRYDGTRHLKLKVYPIVILQLTTLSLLFSLSSASAAVVPAIVPGPQVAYSKVDKMEITQPKEVKSADYAPITDSKNVKEFVQDYFADTPILASIAGCESRDRQFDSNGNVLRGEKNHFDIGVMQINELYHADEAKALGLDIYTIDGNVAFAKHLYEKYGAKPWISSSACWAKFSESSIARK